MENDKLLSEPIGGPDLSPPGGDPGSDPEPSSASKDSLRQQRKLIVISISVFVLFLILIIGSVFFLLQPATPTDRIRDIFIIFMALESLLIGLALVILIIQLARLINLLQNEVRPILDSTNETVHTLRGTVAFLSDNLVEPVVKLNEYLAAMRQLGSVLRFTRKK